MKTFDTTVTIFNLTRDKDTKAELWRHKVVERASWYGGQAVTVNDSGLNSADKYTVRIHAKAIPDGFLMPNEYNKLADQTGYWTVRNGDIVACGSIETDFFMAADIMRNHTSFVVTGCFDNRRGLPRLQHIRIEGK